MRGKQFDGFLTREQVLEKLFAELKSNDKTEYIPLREAAGRITAEDLYSVNTLPVCRVSGCDGIAVRSADFVFGMPEYKKWKEGADYFRADTGDDFPDEYDAVIMIEEVDLDKKGRITYISEDLEVEAGQNVRPAGHILKEGDILVEKDRAIEEAELALLAAGGITMVPVRKKPKAAFIPTGSELIPAGSRPGRGDNIDTNSLMVEQMLKEMGAEPVIFPIVPDIQKELEQRLDEALSTADIVIINAGTAKGSEDFNFRMLDRRGKLLSHYVAAAPGRPLATAVVNGKPVINLPGPPMAAFFAMDWCVRALISRYLHIAVPKRPSVPAVLMSDLRSAPSMAVMTRIHLVKTCDGYEAWPMNPKKGSLAEALRANGIFIKEIGVETIEKGTIIDVELL